LADNGSHRRLTRPGWPNYTFAFHDGDEIGPGLLAQIAKKTGLEPEDVRPAQVHVIPKMRLPARAGTCCLTFAFVAIGQETRPNCKDLTYESRNQIDYGPYACHKFAP
jgi:hypothetical protein